MGRARGLDGPGCASAWTGAWRPAACAPSSRSASRSSPRASGSAPGLAQALIHDPDIIILDEPTSGLDPLQIIGIRQLIRSLAGEKTVIFSTHILQEVSPVTDRVVIINEGRIVADGVISASPSRPWATTACSSRLRIDRRRRARPLRDMPGLTA